MELLNRETNFNKVFKATPNIGVINPLQAKTKPGKEGIRQSSSLAVSSSRLDPIPNMPVHEKKLNTADHCHLPRPRNRHHTEKLLYIKHVLY